MSHGVYLAAPYASRGIMKSFAATLHTRGIPVTSRWVYETTPIGATTVGTATGLDDATIAAHVAADLADIREARTLVLFTAAYLAEHHGLDLSLGNSGGRHVETGYALALGWPVLVVGSPENVFHRGACYSVPDWPAALKILIEVTR